MCSHQWQAIIPDPDPMPKSEPGPNRHHFRIWIKMALQSGLIDRLPPVYEPGELQNPLRTEEFARQLLAELRHPDASRRTLKEIIASARQFKSWVEARRKDDRHRARSRPGPKNGLLKCHPVSREHCHRMKVHRTERGEQSNRIPAPSCIPCGTIGSTAWKDDRAIRGSMTKNIVKLGGLANAGIGQ